MSSFIGIFKYLILFKDSNQLKYHLLIEFNFFQQTYFVIS